MHPSYRNWPLNPIYNRDLTTSNGCDIITAIIPATNPGIKVWIKLGFFILSFCQFFIKR